MKLRGTSQEIDIIETNTVVLSFFEDERPLKGAVGLTDWRMGGFLSRLIMDRWIDGHYAEPLLMPANHRMNSQKVFVIGLGSVQEYDLGRYKKLITQICEALYKIQVNRFALPLPGVFLSGLDPADAAEILGRSLEEWFGANNEMMTDMQVTVVASGSELKRINPVLARLERSIGN